MNQNIMERESGSPVKADCKKAKKGPGRPPKAKPPKDCVSALAPKEKCVALFDERLEKACNASVEVDASGKREADDGALMPPPPTCLTSPNSAGRSVEYIAPSLNEDIIDGFAIASYATEQDVEASLKRCGRKYENKRLNVDRTNIRSPRLTIRENGSPIERKGKGPAKNKMKGDGIITPRKYRKLNKETSLSKEDWENMETDEETNMASTSFKEKNHVLKQDSTHGALKSEIDVKASPQTTECINKFEEAIKCKSESIIKPCSPSTTVTPTKIEFKQETASNSSYSKSAIEPISPPCRPPDSLNHLQMLTKELFQRKCSSSVQHSVTLAAADFSGKGSSTDTKVLPHNFTPTCKPLLLPAFSSSSTNTSSSATNVSSRQPTPTIIGSLASNKDRDSSSNNSRTTSTNSERNVIQSASNPAQPGQQAVPEQIAALFGHLPYALLNPVMLSFPGFNLTAASGTTASSPQTFPFPPNEFLQHYGHGPALMQANSELLRTELSRRMLLESNDRPIAPLIRPDLLFSGAPGSALNHVLPQSLPGSLLNQMYEKMPKLESLQQLLFQRAVAGNMASGTMNSANALGPSPFQSVPGGGGSHSATSSPDNLQRKTGKWCAAHVKIAWNIYKSQCKLHCESKNSTPSNINTLDERRPLAPNLSHSISAITASVHKPKEIPAAGSSQQQVKVTSALSDDKKCGVSNLSSEAQSSKIGSIVSPSNTAQAGVTTLLHKEKSSHAGLNGSVGSDSRWSKIQNNPSPSLASSIWPQKRDREPDRETRKSVGSGSRSSPNLSSSSSNSNRPSPLETSVNRQRSRSRSPLNSTVRSPSNKHSNHSLPLPGEKIFNQLGLRQDIVPPSFLAPNLATNGNVNNDMQLPHHHPLMNTMLSNILTDPKTVANGFYGSQATGIWNPFESQENIIALQYAALQRRLHDTRVANASTPGSTFNGFTQPNILNSIGSCPPPLIPNTQTKPARPSGSYSNSTANNHSHDSDSYQR